jgi:vanillate O-demethylase monooxygenase subunit
VTYVRNAWYVAAWSCDLGNAPLAVSILDEPLVLFRTPHGVSALEDRCVHRHAPLSRGRCEKGKLRCMYHGLLFDGSGRVVEIPGQDMIPPQAQVRAYPMVERHDWVWVWMGDPGKAEPALIPEAVGLSDPQWVLGHGQMDYAAEARLICDNLCDFSHLSYVHAASFGANEDWATSRPKVIPLERGVRLERWMENQPRMAGRGEGLADVWQWYDFLVPGVLLMSSVALPVGSARRHGYQPPGPDRALEGEGITFTSQAVTPMTGKTARYFFSWGPRHDQGDADLRDTLMGVADMAFTEDRLMIEAQQRVIDRDPGRPIMPTSADKGVTLYNRLVERMAREEA